jgi:hypothetical protein
VGVAFLVIFHVSTQGAEFNPLDFESCIEEVRCKLAMVTEPPSRILSISLPLEGDKG